MAADYIIPLGIDSKGVVDGINDTLGSLEKMDAKAKEAGRTIEESFSKGAKAADNLDESLKPSAKSLEDLRRVAQAASGELNDALDIKKGAGEFSKTMDKVRDKLKNITGTLNGALKVDNKTLADIKMAADYIKQNFRSIEETFASASQSLNENISSTKDNIQSITTDIKNMEDAMKGMAPGQAHANMLSEFEAAKRVLEEEKAALADYEGQLKQVSGAQKNMGKTLSDVDKVLKANAGTTKTLRQQYLDIRRELQNMIQAGQGSGEAFDFLTKKAAEMKTSLDVASKTIAVVSQQNVKLKATIQGAQGLIGLFTAYQGVMALFGTENEEVQKILLKVNGAMALLYATQTLSNVLQKDSALSIALLNRFRKTQVATTNAATTATTANTVATKGGTLATRLFGGALKALGIGLIISAIAYLVDNWEELYGMVKKFLPEGEKISKLWDTIKSGAMGVGNAIIKYVASPFKALAALLSGDMDGFKAAIKEGFDFKSNYQEASDKQDLKNQQDRIREKERNDIEAQARATERIKNQGKDVTQIEIALQKRRVALEKKDSKAKDEQQKILEDMEDRHIKEISDKNKKGYQDRLKLEKAAADQLQKLGDDLRQREINAMDEGTQKKIAQARFDTAKMIQVIKDEEALTLEAKKQQTQLIEALIKERNDKITQIEKTALKERAEFELATREKLLSFQKESVDVQLGMLQIAKEKELAFINEAYKNEEDLRIRLIKLLDDNVEAEKTKIQKEWTVKQIKEEEERQILLIELMQSGVKKSEETERQKQIAILQAKLEGSKKILKVLLTSGDAENSIVVLQVKKLIKEIEGAIAEETKGGKKKFDWFEFLGMDNLTGEQKQAITEAVGTMIDSISSITNSIIAGYDAQIAKRQQNIDSIKGEVDSLENELDREKALQDEGLANNVALTQKALAAKKAQMQEEIKQQQEIQKKKEKIQKAQMAADTAMQAVNLITASTNIFKVLSSIPFVGIPLAIATVGLMVGAFIAAKASAAKAVGSQKYGEGGWIKGKSHSQGGEKFHSSNGGVKELEGNEFVVRKKQAMKYKDLLEAINGDKLDVFSAHDNALNSLLNDLGISFVGNSIAKALSERNDLNSLKQNITVKTPPNGERELRQMNRNIDYLAQKEREKVVSWQDEKYSYIKKGNTTTRILLENEPV